MQVEHLTAAPQLAPYRLVDDRLVVLQHIGLHGLTVQRRLLKHAHVAQSAHCHVQRPRDRGCRQCKHVYILYKFLEALLLLNAEALFLVDYRKPQIAEHNVFLHKAVSAYDHIYLAALQLFKDLLLLLGGSEAREKLNADRIALKPLAYGLIVLPREDRGGAEQRALFAVGHAFERRPERYLGFSEADVAAKQSVHRHGALHIALYLISAGELVGGFLILEFSLKIALPLVIARESVALCLHSRRVKGDKLLGYVLYGRLYAGFGLLPVARAKAAELYAAVFLSAYVFSDHVKLGYGHIKHVALCVVDFYVVLGDPVGVDFPDPAENAYSVNAVNDVIAGGKLGQIVDFLPFLFALGLFLRAVSRLPVAYQEKLFRGQLKARAQGAFHYINHAAFGFRQSFCKLRVIAVGFKAFNKVVCRLACSRKHNAARIGGVKPAQILGQLLVGAVPLAELLCRKADDVAKRQRNAAVNKAFQHNRAVSGEKLHALVKGQREAVEAARQNAVLEVLGELLGILVVHSLASVAHI